MRNDKDNVLAVLAARRLAPRARIIASTEQPESEPELKTAGAGRTIGWLNVDEVAGAVLLAVRRPGGGFQFKPGADTALEPGLTLIVMADAEGRSRLEQRLVGRWRLTR